MLGTASKSTARPFRRGPGNRPIILILYLIRKVELFVILRLIRIRGLIRINFILIHFLIVIWLLIRTNFVTILYRIMMHGLPYVLPGRACHELPLCVMPFGTTVGLKGWFWQAYALQPGDHLSQLPELLVW